MAVLGELEQRSLLEALTALGDEFPVEGHAGSDAVDVTEVGQQEQAGFATASQAPGEGSAEAGQRAGRCSAGLRVEADAVLGAGPGEASHVDLRPSGDGDVHGVAVGVQQRRSPNRSLPPASGPGDCCASW